MKETTGATYKVTGDDNVGTPRQNSHISTGKVVVY